MANPDQGGSVLLNQFGAVRFAMLHAGIQSKDFWVTETGWCTSTDGICHDPIVWNTVHNEEIFYQGFLDFSLDTRYTPQGATTTVSPPEKIFYFSVRDLHEHQGGGGGSGFGLYECLDHLTPKF